MCRKKHLRGWCAICFGLGLMAGHSLDSWLLCCLGGFGLLMLGVFLLGGK